MKRLYFLLFPTLIFGQIPTGYYNGTENLSKYQLKTKLSEIITQKHTDKDYGGLWLAYATTDLDDSYEKDGTILDFYSENPNGADPYTFILGDSQCGSGGFKKEGDCYNREHLVPQSLFYEGAPMKNDVHFIVPTDGYTNTMHSNLPFGETFDHVWMSMNTSKKGNSTFPGYTDMIFEPIDEFKGDIARMLLYFITRYEKQLPTFDSNPESPFDGSSDRGFKEWYINMLLHWNSKDPVSQREINRNNAAYDFQGNRNPFIDHPEWIEKIWSSTLAVDNTSPTQPTNISATHIALSAANITWTASTDDVKVVGYTVYLNGIEHGKTILDNYYFTSLKPDTQYQVKIIAEDAFRNKSAVSSTYDFKTPVQQPGIENALFFSEYVEGSSYNKAVEITNTTGNTVDLTEYTIKLQSNGAGDWNTGLNLTGMLDNSNTYVVANNRMLAACINNRTFFLTNSATINFNGNDALGLFKGNQLVDIIGIFNSAEKYGEDKTLRRKTEKGNLVYTASEWEILAKDDCNGLGVLNTFLSTQNTVKTDLKLLNNPAESNGSLHFSGENLSKYSVFRMYDTSGKMVKSYNQPFKTSNNIQINGLTKGIYFIMIDHVTFKVIIK